MPSVLVGLLRVVGIGGMALVIGSTTLNAVVTTIEKKNMVKHGKPCGICKGKGFYMCKLCKASGTIKWSPLHDPVAINPCRCPTCDGNFIQRCLNCLGCGYA
ncbi:hypothetical protein Leryth_013264 [Lithospermum erythrorhizon]|uniref:Uncharacterized protein n=1 Tax=Lithospermum erythrorhizon TaxID=34254 RepID=A0AAV3PQ30_LITER|nr:hypothetical protein Leryth_013264 [Lithospermum erythrorhizon]